MFDSNRTGNFELYTMSPGGPANQITTDAQYDSWSPRVSPDRREILFYRTPAGVHDTDYTQTSLWRVGVDGSELRQLRAAGADGWELQGHAEWSPDGQQLVMFGGSRMNPQLYLTDPSGQQPRALTERPGVNLDPSFTADGAAVLFVGCPQAECYPQDYEIYRVDISDGQAVRLTSDRLRDHDPYQSPAGDHIAWLTQFGTDGIGVWDVQVAAADGSGARRLVGDDGITSRPAWSADGRTVLAHRLPPGGARFGVYAVDVITGRVDPLTDDQPGWNEYPSW